jgi:hypothetical protein
MFHSLARFTGKRLSAFSLSCKWRREGNPFDKLRAGAQGSLAFFGQNEVAAPPKKGRVSEPWLNQRT